MKILKFPFVRQFYEYNCGAAALEAVLVYFGLDVSQREIMKIAKTTKAGTPVIGIKKVLKKYGLKFKDGKMTIQELKKYIDKKIPVIILLQAWSKGRKTNWKEDWSNGHYVVVIGYDKEKIYFEDPASFYRTYLKFEELKERWHDKDKNKKYINYGLAIFGGKAVYSPQKIIHMD